MWKSRKNNSKISISLCISLVMHTLLFTYLVKENVIGEKLKIASQELPTNFRPVKLMEVKTISKAQIAKIKQQLNQQLVQTAQTHKTEEKVVSRFSGESNQKFDRQTIARVVDSYKDAGLGNKVGSNTPTITKTAKANTVKPKLSLSEIGAINLNTDDSKIKTSEIESMAKELEKSHAGALGIANGMEGKTGLAANNDFVEDIPLGDVTNLNTTENKYYGFYHRIRQKLEQYWGSTIHAHAKKLYKSGRRVPASDNLITAVVVVLSDKGQILDIKIEGSSGIRELDQAAVESFNKAGPFPNPPKGLLVDGRAVIQWGFVVKS